MTVARWYSVNRTPSLDRFVTLRAIKWGKDARAMGSKKSGRYCPQQDNSHIPGGDWRASLALQNPRHAFALELLLGAHVGVDLDVTRELSDLCRTAIMSQEHLGKGI